MSSIDKGIKTLLNEYDPRIEVVNNGNGKIKGYLNGKQVFSINDRYGYLHEDEGRDIIGQIQNSELSEEERRRREEERRLERERIRQERERRRREEEQRRREEEERRRREELAKANERINDKSQSAKNDINASVSRVVSMCDEQLARLNKTANLSGFNDYKIDSLKGRINSLVKQVEIRKQQAISEGNERIKNIDKLMTSVNSQDINNIKSKTKELNKISTVVTVSPLSSDDLTNEISSITATLQKVKEVEVKIKQLAGSDSEIASRLNNIVHNTEISSVNDVKAILDYSIEQIDMLKNSKYESEVSGINNEIAKVADELSQQLYNIDYQIKQNARKVSYRQKIVEMANLVISEYESIKNKQFTTADLVEVDNVLIKAQQVINMDVDNEETLSILQNYSDNFDMIATNDKMLDSDYELYVAKAEELKNNGIDVEPFNVHDSENQIKGLNKELVKLDVKKSKDITTNTFVSVVETMQEQGFVLIDNGLSELLTKEESVTCDALFALPGCDGVVWSISVAEDEVKRTLLGIKRNNGISTSVERVMEVAKITEKEGLNQQYIDVLAQNTDVQACLSAVDSIDENSKQIIEENGVYELDEKTEELFDEVVDSASSSEKAKWQSKIDVNAKTSEIKTVADIKQRNARINEQIVLQKAAMRNK